MYTLYFKHVTQDEMDRTKKLLYKVRHQYDIDTYIFTKKMLLVSLIIHYFQKETKRGPWVSYRTILCRYEANSIKYNNKTKYKDFGAIYFGFKKRIILDSTLFQLENIVRDRCIREIGIPQQ